MPTETGMPATASEEGLRPHSPESPEPTTAIERTISDKREQCSGCCREPFELLLARAPASARNRRTIATAAARTTSSHDHDEEREDRASDASPSIPDPERVLQRPRKVLEWSRSEQVTTYAANERGCSAQGRAGSPAWTRKADRSGRGGAETGARQSAVDETPRIRGMAHRFAAGQPGFAISARLGVRSSPKLSAVARPTTRKIQPIAFPTGGRRRAAHDDHRHHGQDSDDSLGPPSWCPPWRRSAV